MRNFNFLLDKKDQLEECSHNSGSSKIMHRWSPTGNFKAILDGWVGVDFYCKRCEKRTTAILDREEFGLHMNNLVAAVKKDDQ